MISIIIPCYNAEKLVGKCIESVLRQTYGALDAMIAVCKTGDVKGLEAKPAEADDDAVLLIKARNIC